MHDTYKRRVNVSFSSDIKSELCKLKSSDIELLKAELYGILLYGKIFSGDKIVFKTENPAACIRTAELLQTLYMPIIERQSDLRAKNSSRHLYKVIVVDSDDCKRIFEDFGHTNSQITLRVNRANVYSDELAAAFIRGVFLSCGSVVDPEKSYHAEFSVPHKNLSIDLCKLLSEISECNFSPKTVVRNGNYVVYFKGSEQICDLLAYMGAAHSAMEVMGAKAVKQVRNNVNRRINGELANIGKSATAAAKQIKAIEHIKQTKGLTSLSDDLREIAFLRLENPEMSLRDLGQSLNPPISRSGANHRIQRIMEYAEIVEVNNE